MTERPIHILMIDDDEDDFFLVTELLRDISPGQYLLEWAPTYQKGIAAIERRVHDVFLVDYRLGPNTGIDIMHHIQEMQYQMPVIMLTGKGDYAIDQEAMQAGAYDYLVKGEITADLLERSIRYALDEYSHLRSIAESEKKYYGIFEKAHDLIVLADCDRNIIDANPAALKTLHYTKEEILRLHLRDLFQSREQSEHFLDNICNNGVTNTQEYEFKNREGKKLVVLINAITLDEAAQIFLCVIQDITEKKKEELEKQYQEKFVITGRIARVIAHEVRNPLTNILLAVSQFKEEEIVSSNEDATLYTDIIERNCTRINQLITELLHSTRMIELHMAPHGINEMVGKALQLSQDRLQLHEIVLQEDLVSPDVLVNADDEKVIIAFLNIIINAVEAMTPSKGILTITTIRHQDKVQLLIGDNGIGIPQEKQARLFDPFYTSKAKGTGLGLTSTQNILLNHKGNIHVDSEPGRGTIFTITLPVAGTVS
ncbi:hybrid sensor histidine kinase/response regulator [Chitinophaga nivalis]|uniref:histidine kinase n=1 Tax=Chitinophaga nivalis TaxID=2991709 RepID=A0ABT3IWN2_9BACT|nr:hybrid sensor histidine kinase/response regulator [Chitinophaga nivalis]MCW3462183.1 ATP-binding protein [Chitinophaga nivalis]MCW3488125.1 ATP-binding protein [Chitinophaga nivalis]